MARVRWRLCSPAPPRLFVIWDYNRRAANYRDELSGATGRPRPSPGTLAPALARAEFTPARCRHLHDPPAKRGVLKLPCGSRRGWSWLIPTAEAPGPGPYSLGGRRHLPPYLRRAADPPRHLRGGRRGPGSQPEDMARMELGFAPKTSTYSPRLQGIDTAGLTVPPILASPSRHDERGGRSAGSLFEVLPVLCLMSLICVFLLL